MLLSTEQLEADPLIEEMVAMIETNEQIYRAWFKETAKDRYLKQSPELFDQLGYTRR